MSKQQCTTSPASRNPILGALANERSRRTLAILLGRTAPVSERDLATTLVAEERDASLVDVTDEQTREVHVDLIHTHLPKLVEVDLVQWDRDGGTAATTDHPALEDPQLAQIVGTDAEDWDAVVATLAHRLRRVVLSVLRDHEDPLALAPLARAVYGRDSETSDDLDPEALAELRTSLHHVHLPKLAEAGLVSYDAEANIATGKDHPALDESWLAFAPDETPQAVVSVANRI